MVKRLILNWILCQKENFFKNLDFINCFSTTKYLRKVLFENSKSARFSAKSLSRHHFEEDMHFWSKNEFWTGYYTKMKTIFQNFGSIICFSTTKSFKKVLFENSKSARFWAKLLARHNSREMLIFGQKMNFELDITPKWKLFSKFWLHKLFLYHQKFQRSLIWKFKKCPFSS